MTGRGCPSILEPHRQFVAEGEFTVQTTEDSSPFLAWVVLFSDTILICERKIPTGSFRTSLIIKSPINTGGGFDDFKFRELISLKGASVVSGSSSTPGFEVVFEAKPMVTYCFYPFVDDIINPSSPQLETTKKEKKKEILIMWIATLMKTIDSLNEAFASFKRQFTQEGTGAMSESLLSSQSQLNLDGISSSTGNPKVFLLITKSEIEEISKNSSKLFLELYQSVQVKDDSVPLKRIKIFVEKLELLSTQIKKLQETQVASPHINTLTSTLTEGKEIIGLFKDFFRTQFPVGKKESEWPRKKMAELMKWYMKLSQEWGEFSKKL